MSLLLERYELKRTIEKASERLKEIDESLLEDAGEGERLDVGNGGFYPVRIQRKKAYKAEAALLLPPAALPEVVKLSESAIKRLAKAKLITAREAEDIDALATVVESKLLGPFTAWPESQLEALESE